MTSMVSRDDVETELYKLAGPYKAAQLPRVMQVIDAYTITVSRKFGGGVVEWTPDPFKYLRPGETDEETGKRRCVSCGKVKSLLKDFAPDYRRPYGRRSSCLDCSPNKDLVREYYCPRCKGRFPLDKFGVKKKKNPRLVYLCLLCETQKK